MEQQNKFIILGSLIIALAIIMSNNLIDMAVLDTTDPVPVNITDPLDVNNHLEVAIQDQATEVIDLFVNQRLDDLTLLANYSRNDRYINVSTTGVVPIISNYVCLKDSDGQAFYQGEVLNVSSLGGNDYELLLDMPLDFPFTINDGCSLNTVDMNVDGSITPQIFKLSPTGLSDGVQWDITRFIGLMRCDGPQGPDDSKFCNEDPLTNGVFMRLINGIWKNGFNFKTNGDLRIRSYDVDIIPLTAQGEHGVSFRRTLNGQDKNGVVLRIGVNDTLEVVIQDDLTNLEFFRMVFQGHVVE